ncbi:MAG TPA: type I-U CRISPR-associated protein Csb2, partial [Gemmataceae bacterium]|nr:type I-U CRISPR-associated protein Csb2 [Gemmataceae bacterium]
EIQFGSQAPWKIDIATADDGPMSLRTVPYVGPRRTWASVTPVLCDRYPKDKDGERTEDVIRESCRRVLGIEPIRVEVGKVSWHRGVPPSNAFYRIRKPEDAPRYRVHVKLSFDREVRGPLLLGAGRFLGLGLFRTYQEEEGSR